MENNNKKTADSNVIPIDDTPQQQEDEEEEKIFKGKNRRRRHHRQHLYPQLIATLIVSWLSIVNGYSMAYSSPAELSMLNDLNLTKNEISWIFSMLPIGAIVGSLTGGPIIEFSGRKKTLLIIDIIFIGGWLMNYFTTNYILLNMSRFLCGYSVGITSFTLPVYLAETVQTKIRGRLGLFPTIFGNLGIVICFLLGIYFQWKDLAGIGVLLSLPFFVMIWMIPETPRWYIGKNKLNKARSALQWFRGKEVNVEKEMQDLLKMRKIDAKVKFVTRLHIKALLIMLGLMFFQQFSGINALMFYTGEIFQKSGSSLTPVLCTGIIGIVNFSSMILPMVLVDKLGRKILLYISSIVMAVMLFILGWYFFLLNVKEWDLTGYGWVPLTCFIIYVVGFSMGLGPIPWLMIGEVLPAAVRGNAAAISAAFNWSCTFIITKAFPIIDESVGFHSIFWAFGLFMIMSLFYIWVFVPETMKKTLEDIERILAGEHHA